MITRLKKVVKDPTFCRRRRHSHGGGGGVSLPRGFYIYKQQQHTTMA
jgi:hypothetical protein